MLAWCDAANRVSRLAGRGRVRFFRRMHVSGLFIYPVKSLRGIALEEAAFDALGLVGDRRFLVIDENNEMLTQRAHPQMATVATALSADTLTLSAEGAGSIAISRASDPSAPLRVTSVWGSNPLKTEDCGEAPAEWLSSVLGVRCRLVRIGREFVRPVKKFAVPGDVVSFADGYPFLVANEASLADLNARIVERGGETVPMDRFRPNIVIADAEAFAEDHWPRIDIDGVVLRSGGPCSRCIMTTQDQRSGERRGPEPLRTLATFRRDAEEPTAVNFAQNFIPETKSGMLRVGASVQVK